MQATAASQKGAPDDFDEDSDECDEPPPEVLKRYLSMRRHTVGVGDHRHELPEDIRAQLMQLPPSANDLSTAVPLLPTCGAAATAAASAGGGAEMLSINPGAARGFRPAAKFPHKDATMLRPPPFMSHLLLRFITAELQQKHTLHVQERRCGSTPESMHLGEMTSPLLTVTPQSLPNGRCRSPPTGGSPSSAIPSPSGCTELQSSMLQQQLQHLQLQQVSPLSAQPVYSLQSFPQPRNSPPPMAFQNLHMIQEDIEQQIQLPESSSCQRRRSSDISTSHSRCSSDMNDDVDMEMQMDLATMSPLQQPHISIPTRKAKRPIKRDLCPAYLTAPDGQRDDGLYAAASPASVCFASRASDDSRALAPCPPAD
ncbi:PREDICTED: uncharacterized protein LOC106821173 [Priapulus caudatus]|uniref:Uncharacterized protein LOC106821173 n=1 Tax=Priapulus caudatus TaxID=37621 RepID=A0ABM1FA82_PRICU|nr:PREDICTED: uncharacterized protein LOC106821173 [Priapulus caudatus]